MIKGTRQPCSITPEQGTKSNPLDYYLAARVERIEADLRRIYSPAGRTWWLD